MDKPNSSWLKTLSIGFSIISFGITIAIIGYFVLTTKQNQPTNQQSSIVPTAIPTPTSDLTTNWQVLSLDDLQFKIPETWSSRKYEYQIPKVGISYQLNPTPLRSGSDVPPALSVSHQPNTSVETYKEDSVKSYYMKSVTEKQIVIPGHSGLSIEGVTQPDPTMTVPIPIGQPVRIVLFQINNDVYAITNEWSQYDSIFDQILSTFKLP